MTRSGETAPIHIIHSDGRIERFKDLASVEDWLSPYFYAVLENVITELRHGHEFYLCWAGNTIPRTVEENSILFWLGDEKNQLPQNAEAFKAVFRSGNPSLLPTSRPARNFVFPLETIRAARDLIQRLQSAGISSPFFSDPPNLSRFPIGPSRTFDYRNASSLYLAPSERTTDVSYVGGIGATRKIGPVRIPQNAKSASRLALVQAFRTFKSQHPEHPCYLGTGMECDSPLLNQDQYFDLVRTSKIFLAPRGNYPETFRLFEAASLGTIVITDPLPNTHFFKDHPFIELNSWSKLESTLESLLKSDETLNRLSEQTLHYWNHRVSPEAMSKNLCQTCARSSDL